MDGARELLVEDILRQAHDDGAGAALLGLEEGLRHHAGGARGIVENEDLLGLGAEPRLGVELLEGLAVAVGDRDEADEEDQRSGVLPGGVDAHEGVGRAGSARDHGHARLAGGLAVGLCHVRRAAFLAGDDGLHRGVVESVEDRQEAFAGHKECAADAVRGEGFGDSDADV